VPAHLTMLAHSELIFRLLLKMTVGKGLSDTTNFWRAPCPHFKKGLGSSKQPTSTCCAIIATLMLVVLERRLSSSCFGLVPEVGISRHECTQKQILCRVQSCFAQAAVPRSTPCGHPGAVVHGTQATTTSRARPAYIPDWCLA